MINSITNQIRQAKTKGYEFMMEILSKEGKEFATEVAKKHFGLISKNNNLYDIAYARGAYNALVGMTVAQNLGGLVNP